MSRKLGRDQMYKGLGKKFQKRFDNQPTIDEKVKEKLAFRRKTKSSREKSHNREPRRYECRKKRNNRKNQKK